MTALIALLLWCILLLMSWPLALFVLIAWPLACLFMLILKLLGTVLSSIFTLLGAILLLPARILGWRPNTAS